MKPTVTKLSVAICLAFASSSVVAATTPDIGDALRQSQLPVVPAQAAPNLPQLGEKQQAIEAPMAELPSGPKIEVKKIEVVGNREIGSATLNSLVADASGKSLTLTELEALARRITKYYRANGYFVARAYIPAQEVSSGTVNIRVVEGNYGKFHLKNQSLVNDDLVQAMLDEVKHYDIVSLDTLERAMLIINDTPGVQVIRADVMPGEKIGTSDFAVDTAATSRYAGYLMFDNYGSVYTGKDRVSFNVDDNSLSGHGDRLSVSGLDTTGGGLVNARVGYSLPLAPNGLREEFAYSQTQYQLGDTYAPLDALGTAKGFDAITTYPVRRTRAQTIEASLDISHKNLDDKVLSTNTDTPKSSTSATVGLSIKDERPLIGFYGLTQASAKITYGQLNINDPTALAQDAAGAQTQGNYSKLVAELSRISLLPNDFSLTTSLKIQQSFMNKNLDGSERMAVSGYAGVMAYPSGELIGSDAIFVRAELSRPLPTVGKLKSNWLVFADWGDAKQQNPLQTDVNRNLSDVGLGWQASYGSALLRTHLAHRLSTEAVSEPCSNNNFLVQVIFGFDTPPEKFKAEPEHVEVAKAQVEVPIVQVAPIARVEVSKDKTEVPVTQAETPKVQAEMPVAQVDAPVVQNEEVIKQPAPLAQVAETAPPAVAEMVTKVEPAPLAEVVTKAKNNQKITLEGVANFASGSAVLNRSANNNLDKVVDIANSNQSDNLLLTGYTDNRGNATKNIKLSVARAVAFKTYLVKHGVAAARIQTSGAGDSNPVADNKTSEGRSKNRRVEITLVPKEVGAK